MVFFCFFASIGHAADALIDTSVRLLNPPAFRVTCLPFADFVTVEPVEIGKIPSTLAQQTTFLTKAKEQGIYIGFEKVGPFEENRGMLHTSCQTGESLIHMEFSYTNYPTIFDKNGIAISAQGFFDGLNSLSLDTLTIDGISVKNWPKDWPDFMNQCAHPQCPSKFTKLIIYPKQQTVLGCFASSPQCKTLKQ